MTTKIDKTCPCGRRLSILVEECVIEHQLPECDEFKRLDALEFMRYVRRWHGCTCPDDDVDPACEHHGKVRAS